MTRLVRMSLVWVGLFVFGLSPLTYSQTPSENRVAAAAILRLISDENPRIATNHAQLIASTIVQSSDTANIDPKLIAAIIAVESQFNHRASHGSSQGLGQLTRATARGVGVNDPFSITQNIYGTTRYFQSLMAAWRHHPEQISMALASYLTGPRRAALSGRSKRYVDRVLRVYTQLEIYEKNTTLQ